jgi:hypothetical protein
LVSITYYISRASFTSKGGTGKGTEGSKSGFLLFFSHLKNQSMG